MKKNIIMIIITLVCSLSLLIVLYSIKTKDIKYISEVNNNGIELSMTLSGNTITSFSQLDNTKYYRLNYTNNATNCGSNTSTKLYWSNSSKSLKVKGATSPLKCTIAFEEIREDINIIAIYVNGVEQTTSLPQTTNYYLDTENSNCSGGETITFENETKQISITPLTKQTYCNIYLKTGRKVNILVSNGYIQGGYILTNEILNGNFENDFTYWGDYDVSYVIIDTSSDKCPERLCPGNTKSFKNTSATNQQGIIRYWGLTDSVVTTYNTYDALLPKTSHTYYFSIHGKNTTSLHNQNHVMLGEGTYIAPSIIPNPNWVKVSGMGVSLNSYVNFSTYVALGWVTGTSNGEIWLDDTMLIDMTQAFGNQTNYTSYRILVDRMPYFEPYGSIKTDVISSSATTYQISSSYKIHPSRYVYTTLNIINGACTVSGNTLTVPAGSSDLTCIIKYS